MSSDFSGGEPTPNAPLLTGVNGVVSAGVQDGATVAEFPSRADGFLAEFTVWEVFREKHLGKPLTGNFAGGVYSEEQFAMWVVAAKHDFTSLGGKQ